MITLKYLKRIKKGLAGKFKVIGQIGVGVIVGAAMYWSDGVTIKSKTFHASEISVNSNDDYINKIILGKKQSLLKLPYHL